MQTPPAMYIEAAADSLKDVPASVRVDQLKELHSFGDERARRRLGASGVSEDFEKGYELGLQVARVMLETNPAAQAAKIDF